MKIEILFPELCNLFGDMATVEYLKKTLPEAEFIETHLNDELKFLKEKINLVYMGPMTENTQELVIEKFKPHKDEIMAEIEKCPEYDAARLPIKMIPDFKEAVLSAKAMAERGDIVLLSPACASFDAFRDFEARGNCFKEIINGL